MEEQWAINLSLHYKQIILSSFLKPEIWYFIYLYMLHISYLVKKGHLLISAMVQLKVFHVHTPNIHHLQWTLCSFSYTVFQYMEKAKVYNHRDTWRLPSASLGFTETEEYAQVCELVFV